MNFKRFLILQGLLFIVMTLILFNCQRTILKIEETVPVIEKKTIAKEKIISMPPIYNEPWLIDIYSPEQFSPCGLTDDDFKKYVEKRTQDLNVVRIKYDWKVSIEGIRCITAAWVFIKIKS